jgi:DNA-binding MarR family transcriptional regulator
MGPIATKTHGEFMTATPFVDSYLAYLLARASHLLSSQFHGQLAAAGVQVPTWRVLSSLYDRDGLTVGALAELVLLKQPTLSKAIDRMIKEGLVARAPSEDDRRQVRVVITPKGRTLVRDLIAQALSHEEEILKGYSADEKKLLKTMLQTLISRLSSPVAAPRPK